MAHDPKPSADDALEAKRDTIRPSLKQITAELNSELVTTGLAYPVYVSFPRPAIQS
jgi:hypothetical protein